MAFRLVTFILYLSAVNGCQFFHNPGLLLNDFQDSGTNIVVNTNRYSNTNTSYNSLNPVTQINFTKPIDIMQSDQLNYFVRICESGYLELAPTEAELQACKASADITGSQANLTQAIIVADYIDNTATMTNFQVEAYHIIRSQQYSASNVVTGPSYCDLQILQGIIADCEEKHRKTFQIDEALVVTWRITNSTSGTNYDFQAFIAVTNDNRTFVGFIYENFVSWTGVNGFAKGIIHAKNDDLSGQQRVSQICSPDNMIHKKSNCKCSEPGHHVFETTESTTGPHGFCGTETGKDTCATSAALKAMNKNDPDSSNKNCRTPRYSQNTCDDSYYCTLNTSPTLLYGITIFFKNYANKDRVAFLNYTSFTAPDGSTGFDAPYGNNTEVLGRAFFCTRNITLNSNDSYSNVTRSFGTPNTCFVFDSTTNSLKFVLLLYNEIDGPEIYTDGSRIIVGSCDLDDLPQILNDTFKAGDISSTTVATRTGQKAYLEFRDSRNVTTSQTFTSSDTVQLGRYIFPTVCFVPAAQYTPNVDSYGAYVYSCEFANNRNFVNDSSTNRAMTVVMDNGCLSSTPAAGQAGRLLEAFKVYSQSTITNPLCQTTRFSAFRWNVNNPPSTLWMRCKIKLCVNTQLFLDSKCFDSCANTLVNANITDDDDAGRRRRDVTDDEIELVASITVVDVEMPSQVTKDCADPVMAKGVIGALVALLIVSTILTIVLFVIFQKQKQC